MRRMAWFERLLSHSVIAAVMFFAVLSASWAHAVSVSGSAQLQPMRNVIAATDLEPFFRQEILKRLPWKDGDMEIMRFQTFPSEVAVSGGNVEIETEAPAGQRPLGMFSCIFTIKTDGRIERRVRGCGFVEVYRPVVCVTRAFPRGHILGGDDIKLVRQPLSRLYDDFFDSTAAVSGLVLTRSVQAGQVLTGGMAGPPMLVHRGDIVTILAESPYFTITTSGKVMQDGSLGKLVKVRNIMSKRDVVGVVKDARTVVVRF